jgi:DNA-binding transcriptional regulator LsrR (DeoR family)
MLRSTPENVLRAYEVSQLRVAGHNNREIARRKHLDEATVSRLLTFARDQGILLEIVQPPHAEMVALEALREEMEARLGLREVRLVPGLEELVPEDPARWDRPLASALRRPRESIFRAAARAAAEFMKEKISEHRVLCLAWGQVVQAVMQFLPPVPRRPALEVLPMLGALQLRPGQTEANSLVRQCADIFGAGSYACLPIPSIVPGAQEKQVAVTLPLVRDVLERLEAVDFVVASVAAPDPERSTLARLGLVPPETIEGLIAAGAVGEICAHWFDDQGMPVGDPVIQPIGMGLDGLRGVIRRRGRVMATVAGDCTRIRALAAAIRGGLVNVLVTDHVTGRALLRLWTGNANGT